MAGHPSSEEWRISGFFTSKVEPQNQPSRKLTLLQWWIGYSIHTGTMGYMADFQLPVVVGIVLMWRATALLPNGIGGSSSWAKATRASSSPINRQLVSSLRMRGAIPPLPFMAKLRQRQITVLCNDAASCKEYMASVKLRAWGAPTVLLLDKKVTGAVHPVHATKTNSGSRGVVPLILIHGSRQPRNRSLYPPGKELRYQLNGRFKGPQNRAGLFGGHSNAFPYRDSNPGLLIKFKPVYTWYTSLLRTWNWRLRKWVIEDVPLSHLRILFVFVSLFSDILLINVGVNRQVQDGLWQITWEGCVGVRAGLDDFGEKKMSCLSRDSSAGPSTRYRHYRLHGLLGGRWNRRIKYRICFFMGIFCDPLEVCGGLGQRLS